MSLIVYSSNPGGIQYHLIVYPRIDVATEVAKASFSGKHRLIKTGIYYMVFLISQNLDIAMLLLLIKRPGYKLG